MKQFLVVSLSQFPAAENQTNTAGAVCGIWDGLGRTAQLFVYFQILDLMTTLLGFRLGASEASPFIRLLMHSGQLTGLLLSKLLAVALAGACLYLNRRHLLRWANYWYAALVLWNLLVILAHVGGGRG